MSNSTVMVGGKRCGITERTDYKLKCIISKEVKLSVGLEKKF